LMVVKCLVEFFWVVTSYNVAVGYRRFGRLCYLHYTEGGGDMGLWKVGSYCNITGRHNPEDLELNYLNSSRPISPFQLLRISGPANSNTAVSLEFMSSVILHRTCY
jgi:hypothetical protein